MLFENLVSTEFVNKVQTIADDLNVNPDWLMYVMWNETAHTFRPDIKNPLSTATGLIQFLESTANNLGTTTADLAQMTAVEQLDYVEKYFQAIINQYGALNSVSDVYLAVFYPAAIIWDESKAFSNRVENVNKIFDVNGDGTLTKAEFEQYVNDHYSKAGGSNIDLAGATIPMIAAAGLTTDNSVVLAGALIVVVDLVVLLTIFVKLATAKAKK